MMWRSSRYWMAAGLATMALAADAVAFVPSRPSGTAEGDIGWGGMLGQMIGGLNPLADYRDTVAGVRNIRNNPASLSAWAGFGGALVGWLPVKGDVAKGVILAGRQTAKEVAQAAARSTDEVVQASTRSPGGLATGTDEAVFWSGIGRGGDAKAANWVAQHGGATLETTMAARGIKLPAWDPNNPAVVAAWKQASIDFAAGARGNVRVLQGDSLRIDAIWRDEFKALQANPSVNSIRSINPDTGAEVLLWSR